PDDLRVPGAESLPSQRETVDAPLLLDDAGAPADGQHGCRLGSAAGGRVRPVHARLALALPEDCVSQPSRAVSRIRRPGGHAAAPPCRLEARLLSLLAVPYLQRPAPSRAQVADAHLPD